MLVKFSDIVNVTKLHRKGILVTINMRKFINSLLPPSDIREKVIRFNKAEGKDFIHESLQLTLALQPCRGLQ